MKALRAQRPRHRGQRGQRCFDPDPALHEEPGTAQPREVQESPTRRCERSVIAFDNPSAVPSAIKSSAFCASVNRPGPLRIAIALMNPNQRSIAAAARPKPAPTAAARQIHVIGCGFYAGRIPQLLDRAAR